jgi:hypothetical protein
MMTVASASTEAGYRTRGYKAQGPPLSKERPPLIKSTLSKGGAFTFLFCGGDGIVYAVVA